jgi:hypothetical protein
VRRELEGVGVARPRLQGIENLPEVGWVTFSGGAERRSDCYLRSTNQLPPEAELRSASPNHVRRNG